VHIRIAALRLRNGSKYVLVFSIYVPPMDFHISNTLQTMQATLDEINAVIPSHTENPGRSVQLLQATLRTLGDQSNCWWLETSIATIRRGPAARFPKG